jgi:hypothetical protein
LHIVYIPETEEQREKKRKEKGKGYQALACVCVIEELDGSSPTQYDSTPFRYTKGMLANIYMIYT